MNILAIGNSFSQDATRYLHEISKAGANPLKVVDLVIGGCSLQTHCKNTDEDARAYCLEFNGCATGFFVSVREALQSDAWDYVTMQQASILSFDYNTYTPYLRSLSDYVKLYAPAAKQVFHRTWGYENGSEMINSTRYKSHSEMFADIKAASEAAAKNAGIGFIIPSGDLIETMVLAKIESVYRDGFHLGLGAGRYAVAALWYERLTGGSIEDNNFCGFDEDISPETLREIKRLVRAAGQNLKNWISNIRITTL